MVNIKHKQTKRTISIRKTGHKGIGWKNKEILQNRTNKFNRTKKRGAKLV